VTESIHPNTTVGAVHLTVPDIERSLSFYQQYLGFKLQRREGDTAYLGAGGSSFLALTERPGARPALRATGLYHFAILVPSRLKLAQSLRRMAETRTPVQGASDHLVSEAIYLDDPDGNGIEIYRDRPRAEWQLPGGQIRMATEPLDIDGVMAEMEGKPEPWTGLHPATVLGHMHLKVANIAEAEAFYSGVLGFDLMARYGSAASFLSAGGYHHHIGMNTWESAGAPPPPPDSVGLRWFTIRLPDAAELGKVAERVREAGLSLEEYADGLFVRDPAQNGVVLTAEDGAS